jgi:hypothetical protein
MPFPAAVSIFLIISFNAASACGSFFCVRATKFFTLVLTALFADLLRRRLSSLLRCLFYAESFFLATYPPIIIYLSLMGVYDVLPLATSMAVYVILYPALLFLPFMGVCDVPKECRKHLRWTTLMKSMSSSGLACDVLMSHTSYLKSDGRRSLRLHFSHSAMFFTLPSSKRVFILISPPHEHINLWVALAVRLFLLAWAMVFLLSH